ncbi:MAG: Ig-like domain-containing protein [Bacteroides sp.]
MEGLLSIFRRLFWVLLAGLLLWSCARVVAPVGGEKDVQPPRVVRTVPENGSTGFRGQRFRLYFDEYVKLVDASKQIVVSPPLRYPVQPMLKGKSLEVRFTDTLPEDATYTVRFGQAIADLTEGNPLGRYEYVFGTGAQLDSLELWGVAYDALLHSPVEGAMVLLYRRDADSLPLQVRPDFVARTDAKGEFHFTNLPAGPFKVFALVEKNATLIWDDPSEPIAFADSTVRAQGKPAIEERLARLMAGRDSVRAAAEDRHSPGEPVGEAQGAGAVDSVQPLEDRLRDSLTSAVHTSGTRLMVFTQRWPNQKFLRGVRTRPNLLSFTFSQRVDTLFGISMVGHPEAGQVLELRGDTVNYWLLDTVLAKTDSLRVRFSYMASDSARRLTPRVDTLWMVHRMKPEPTGKESGSKAEKRQPREAGQSASKVSASQGKSARSLGVRLAMRNPVAAFPSDTVAVETDEYAALDSTKVRLLQLPDSTDTPFSLFRYTVSPRRVEVTALWQAEKRYRIYLLPGAFTDIWGRTNDTVSLDVQPARPSSYSIVRVRLENAPAGCLVQLVTPDGKRELKRQGALGEGGSTVVIDYVDPGSYGIRLVHDANGNGRWDTGDYFEHRQPEEVRYFRDEKGQSTVKVRANWEYDFTIDYSQQTE